MTVSEKIAGPEAHLRGEVKAQQRIPRMRTDKLRRVCEDFEGILLAQMLRAMRNTLPSGGIFPASVSTHVWESHFDGALGKALGAAGRLGIADLLYREIASSLTAD